MKQLGEAVLPLLTLSVGKESSRRTPPPQGAWVHLKQLLSIMPIGFFREVTRIHKWPRVGAGWSNFCDRSLPHLKGDPAGAY